MCPKDIFAESEILKNTVLLERPRSGGIMQKITERTEAEKFTYAFIKVLRD